MVLVLVFLAFGILTGGFLFNRAQEQHLIETGKSKLTAIARLKMDQIIQWRKERLGDAGYIMESRFAPEGLAAWKTSRNSEDREEILRRFRGIQTHYPYDDITLVDSNGTVLTSLNNTLEQLSSVTLGYLAVALRENRPVLSDLYYCNHNDRAHIDVIAPIFRQQEGSSTALGAVILCIDAHQFLFPLIQSWPMPSRTAEILLVRRDGNDVLFLNDLRHQENTALKLKRPLSLKDLPAAMAVLGKEGLVQGKDYRGVDVQAVIGPVPSSPWFMVTKVDTDEACSALQYRARFNLALTLGLLAAMLTAAGLFWQQRQKEHYLALYRAELDRRALLKHFEHLVKYANDIILLMDREARITEANESALNAYGYTREEMVGLPVRDLVAVEEPGSHEAAMREMAEKGSALYETVHLRKDGAPFPVEVSARLIEVEGEQYLQAIIRDITERKRAEEQTRRNEARLKSLVKILQYRSDSLQDFLDSALDEAISLTESKIGYIYHYSEDKREFVLNTWSRDVMKECLIAEKQALYQLEKTGIWGEAVRQRRPILINDFQAPHPLKKGYPEGHAELYRYMTLPVFDGDNIVAVVGVANKESDYDETDELQITLLMSSVWKAIDGKRAEARIEHLNRVLRAIRKINQLIIHERDPLKLIQDTCNLLVETRGYGGAMIVLTNGTEAPHTFVEAGLGEAFQPLAERLRQGKLPPCCEAARAQEETYFVTDRSRICALCPLALSCPPDDTMSTRLHHDGKTHGFLAVSISQGLGRSDEERSLFAEVARDVAFALHNFELEKEARKAAEERRNAEGKLQQAQKMEALGTLAGGIAHDFNNILGIIMGYAEIARLESTEESPLRAQLQEVLKAAGRATDLVKQILAFCRQSEQDKRPMLMSPVVKETIKMLRASLPSTIEIKSKVSAKATVPADPTQIHQVLMNLCTNAGHAMQEHGGSLEIELSDIRVDPKAIKPYSELQPGPYVQLTVKDTGQGIDPAVMDRIFDPFFTTKKPGVGTGLGLSVVHGIVKSYGGSIEVESKPGQGTAFRILFPATETHIQMEKEEDSFLPQGNERVLVVDDEPALATITRQSLERLGYQVESRTSSIEALEAFRHQGQEKPFDLVITDMTMPHMTGLDLTRELLQLQPKLPIILCTGFSEKTSAEQAMSYGIQGFLMKPVVLRELARLVRRVLDQTKVGNGD